jgi:hypothetical protein
MMSDEVCAAVLALTRQPNSTYEQHLSRVLDAGRIAVAVKMAELEDNLNTARLTRLVQSDRSFDPAVLQRHEQYRNALTRLTNLWMHSYA